jgi:adenylate cyclase
MATLRLRRVAGALEELDRRPRLVEAARQMRALALGEERYGDALSTVRGRPADRAARQLVALRGERPGVLGELALTALQGWQRLSEAQGRGRGELDVAVLFTDLAGFSSWAL